MDNLKKINLGKPKSRKPKIVKIIASIFIIVFLITVATIAINNWFQYHFFVFQSPIIFQQPVQIKVRKIGYISPLSTKVYAASPSGELEPTYSPRTEIIVAVTKEWGPTQVEAAENIIQHESGFEPCKINGGAVDCNYTGNRAAGMPQALPFTKMGCALSDAKCQAKWFVKYVSERYGNPQNCWKFWTENNWY